MIRGLSESIYSKRRGKYNRGTSVDVSKLTLRGTVRFLESIDYCACKLDTNQSKDLEREMVYYKNRGKIYNILKVAAFRSGKTILWTDSDIDESLYIAIVGESAANLYELGYYDKTERLISCEKLVLPDGPYESGANVDELSKEIFDNS